MGEGFLGLSLLGEQLITPWRCRPLAHRRVLVILAASPAPRRGALCARRYRTAQPLLPAVPPSHPSAGTPGHLLRSARPTCVALSVSRRSIPDSQHAFQESRPARARRTHHTLGFMLPDRVPHARADLPRLRRPHHRWQRPPHRPLLRRTRQRGRAVAPAAPGSPCQAARASGVPDVMPEERRSPRFRCQRASTNPAMASPRASAASSGMRWPVSGTTTNSVSAR